MVFRRKFTRAGAEIIRRSREALAKMSAPSSCKMLADIRETSERYEIPTSLSKGVVRNTAPPSNVRRATERAVHTRVILMASVSVTSKCVESMLDNRKTRTKKSIAAISGLNDRLSFETLHLWQIANNPKAAIKGSALAIKSSDKVWKDEMNIDRTRGATIKVR